MERKRETEVEIEKKREGQFYRDEKDEEGRKRRGEKCPQSRKRSHGNAKCPVM